MSKNLTVIGEFGGITGGPNRIRAEELETCSHIEPGGVDIQRQETFVDCMVEKIIQGCYWALNPESCETGGIYLHEYELEVNEGGRGTRREMDPREIALLRRLRRR